MEEEMINKIKKAINTCDFFLHLMQKIIIIHLLSHLKS